MKNDELRLARAPIHLYELVNVVLTICGPLVNNKPVELRNLIKPSLPAVYADENRVQQILYNLVGNAIKYTDQGQITVAARVHADQIEISVEDTGKGIRTLIAGDGVEALSILEGELPQLIIIDIEMPRMNGFE